MGISLDLEARNIKIAAMVKQHPEMEYPGIAAHFAVTPTVVSKVARSYGLQRWPRTRVRVPSPEIIRRNERIVAVVKESPGVPYSEIGAMFGVSRSLVSDVARAHGIIREAGLGHTGRPPSCCKCGILLDKIDEGVALVEGNLRACQDCVERYHLGVVEWQRPPVKRDEGSYYPADIATARWPEGVGYD